MSDEYADAILRYGLYLLTFNLGIIITILAGSDAVFLYAGLINIGFVIAGLNGLRRASK